MNFSSSNNTIITPDLPDAELYYFPQFIESPIADTLLKKFLTDLEWQQHNIRIFGKIVPQPRLSALYAQNRSSYTYSNLTLTPAEFTPELKDLQNKLKDLTNLEFTHCLANLYRDGQDSMGWHSDDEKELGKEPVIASLSFGGKRKFQMKHKSRKEMKFQIEPEHGSLLIMAGQTQASWKHQIPKTKKEVGIRVNLTFRIIT